ncbi:unnamed protein product, partial [Laminaria digitata]
MMEVNATLVETLLDCLLKDLTCATVAEYVRGELVNVEENLGFRVSVDVPYPPSHYVGPLEFHDGGGLPTVRHTKNDGSWRLHPSWTQGFDPNHDKARFFTHIDRTDHDLFTDHLQIIYSSCLVEIFSRAFLSEQAGSAHAGGYGKVECESSGDCPAGACQQERKFGSETDSGANSATDSGVNSETDSGENSETGSGANSETDSGPRSECVRGRCGCPSGFHHIALGVGLERDEAIGQYTVQDGALERGAPLWTEVNWRKIGVEVSFTEGRGGGAV